MLELTWEEAPEDPIHAEAKQGLDSWSTPSLQTMWARKRIPLINKLTVGKISPFISSHIPKVNAVVQQRIGLGTEVNAESRLSNTFGIEWRKGHREDDSKDGCQVIRSLDCTRNKGPDHDYKRNVGK